MRRISFLLSLWVVPALCLAQVPKSNHVVVVLEENHSYSSVVGNTAMPYFNSLASQNVLFTQYYANTHPSIGNYFMMTTGQIITNNDSFTGTVTQDNIVRHMLTAGKTWKSYAESLPSVGYTGGNTGAYVRRHNPFTYFSDVLNSSVEKLNLVPFTQFAIDMNNNALPNFSYIIPNVNDDAHNGTLSQADNWLKTYIAPLLANPGFQSDGILIIVFDESTDTDTAHGGGHIAALMVGPGVKKDYRSSTLYQHQNILRTAMDALGITSYPGAAATAADMSDAFTPLPSPSPSPSPTPAPNPSVCSAGSIGVTVCSPGSGSTVASPVRFTAAARSNVAITAMRIYLDNVSVYLTHSGTLDVSLPVAAGTHKAVVQAWDSSGAVFKTGVSITVTPTTSGCTAATSGVTICSPAGGSTVGSPVQVTAAAKSGLGSITAMRIYLDNVSVYLSHSASLDASLPVAAGSHKLVVQAWDSAGAVYKTTVSVTVGLAASACTASTVGVTVCSPGGGSTMSSPLLITAAAKSALGTITAMRIYADNLSVYATRGDKVNTSVPLAPGAHKLVVQAWDSTGAVYKSARTITTL
jgi:acid phosphatase